MTSSDETETWQPKPPELLPPWHTPEREELQLQARRFAMDEVLPVANELDPQKGEIPASLLDRLAELGYFGITVPAEHGGLGLGVFEYCMVSEELARAWMSTASILARSQGLGTAVADAGRRRRAAGPQRARRVDRRHRAVRARRRLRPGRGHHPRRPRGRRVGGHRAQALVRQREGGRLHPGARARARTRSRGSRGRRAWSTCCWRRSAASSPRGCPATRSTRSATTASSPGTSRFDGVRIPKDNVIDEARAAREESDEEGEAAEQAGFAEAQKFLNTARVHTAARAVGLARAALEDSILYLQEREQFGHPIGDFQALRFAVAEMAAQIEQSRAFYRQVAHLLDLGVACEKEASMVKLEATEMSVRVTNQAMQLHGGNGYTTERQVERHWRDARLTTIFEGTSEIQKRIISDRLLPRGAR